MNKEDYNKYYIQGSDHYLIPKDVFKELFNEMVNWKEEVKELQKQLEYLRSGEYYNQLRFERDMLQYVADNGKVSKEDKTFIDMTHRNTELLEVIEEVREYINEKIKFNDEQIKEYKTCINTNINGKFSKETKDNMERSISILMSVNCKMRGILQILDKAKEN